MCELQKLFDQFEQWLRSWKISPETVKTEVWDRISKLMQVYPELFCASKDKTKGGNFREIIADFLSWYLTNLWKDEAWLSEKCWISNKTTRNIISLEGHGKILWTLSWVAENLWIDLVFELQNDRNSHVLIFDGNNPADFCAEYVRICRAIAWISAKELDARISEMKWKTRVSNAYTSKIEWAKNKGGISIEILQDIGEVCWIEGTLCIIQKNK